MIIPPFDKADELPLTARTTLRPGDPVKVRGVRGRFRFMAAVTPHDRRRSGWVDVYADGHGVRSFAVKRITKGRR